MSDRHGPATDGIRPAIATLAMAVIVVLLLKYFVVESSEIPTGSMQPTLIGSSAAGVFDRVLVDKTWYLVHEPRRWEVAAFRHPLRMTQNHLKRIVGLPGEQLRISGGNIYLVTDDHTADPEGLRVLRRPPAVQEDHWLEVFPARAALRGEQRILGASFAATGGIWSEADGVLTVGGIDSGATATLRFVDAPGGGLVDSALDGCPRAVAKAMRGDPRPDVDELVQDVRLQVSLRSRDPAPGIRVELEIVRPSRPRLLFGLDASAGQARLIVMEDDKLVAASLPFGLSFGVDSERALRFTHLDDECVVEIGGREVGRLDCSAFRTLQPLTADESGARVELRMVFRGQSGLQVRDLRIDRDLHYRPTCVEGMDPPTTFTIPAGHYFVLGDSPRQSIDSRDWTAITVGRDASDRLVEPGSPLSVQAIRGNLRTVPVGEPIEPDENPVVLPREKRILFTDISGSLWNLEGELVPDPHIDVVTSLTLPRFRQGEDDWCPRAEPEHYVSRQDLLGRPFLVWWPLWPVFRAGVIH